MGFLNILVNIYSEGQHKALMWLITYHNVLWLSQIQGSASGFTPIGFGCLVALSSHQKMFET